MSYGMMIAVQLDRKAEFDALFRGPGSAEFREDAWRVAMNWSVDWSWWAKDPRQRDLSDRLQAFFESRGMEGYGDNWKLDGTVAMSRRARSSGTTTACST